MGKIRGEEKNVHFPSLIFEKKKENDRKEIQIFLTKYFCILDQNAFKNFNVIKGISKFSAPLQPTENFLVTLMPHDKNTPIVTRILSYSPNNHVTKCYFNI